RLAEADALEVVANGGRDSEAEFELRTLGKRAPQATVVDTRLIADVPHDRQQLAAKLREQLPNGGVRHALVHVIDQRVGDMPVRREEFDIFASKLKRPLEIRAHRRKIVARARSLPRIVGGGAERALPLDER